MKILVERFMNNTISHEELGVQLSFLSIEESFAVLHLILKATKQSRQRKHLTNLWELIQFLKQYEHPVVVQASTINTIIQGDK